MYLSFGGLLLGKRGQRIKSLVYCGGKWCCLMWRVYCRLWKGRWWSRERMQNWLLFCFIVLVLFIFGFISITNLYNILFIVKKKVLDKSGSRFSSQFFPLPNQSYILIALICIFLIYGMEITFSSYFTGLLWRADGIRWKRTLKNLKCFTNRGDYCLHTRVSVAQSIARLLLN